jgi:hypothetical protein
MSYAMMATKLGLGDATPDAAARSAVAVASAERYRSLASSAEVVVAEAVQFEESLGEAFLQAVRETDADVGLLHRRTDAFLYTLAVHGLDPGMHLRMGVSLWDPAMLRLLQGKTLLGCMDDSVEAATVSRRLRHTVLPRFVLALPIILRECVEAVVELGRYGCPFLRDSRRHAMESMHTILL